MRPPSTVRCAKAGIGAGDGSCVRVLAGAGDACRAARARSASARFTRLWIRGCISGDEERCRFRRMGFEEGPCIREGMPVPVLARGRGVAGTSPRRRRLAASINFAAVPRGRGRSLVGRSGSGDSDRSARISGGVSEVESSDGDEICTRAAAMRPAFSAASFTRSMSSFTPDDSISSGKLDKSRGVAVPRGS